MADRGTQMAAAASASPFMTREFLSKACPDFVEDILRKTFDEEEPLTQAPTKCSQETQTYTRDSTLATPSPKKKFLF